jgi:hypothetical protein
MPSPAPTSPWGAGRCSDGGASSLDQILERLEVGLKPRMRVTPSHPTPAQLAALQALLDRSTQTATPAVADSVAYPARQMSAAEFVEFWRSVRLVAMATVGPAGQPHIAPVHAELAGTTLRLRIYEDTVRRQDLAANPHVAFTTWRADQALVPEAPSEREGQLEIRTCLDAWLARHPGVEAEIIA